MLQATNRLAEAEPLMRRVLAILRRFAESTGHKHPHMQAAIRNYMDLLLAMGLTEDARPQLKDLLYQFYKGWVSKCQSNKARGH